MGIILTVALQSGRTGGKGGEKGKKRFQDTVPKHINCNQTIQGENSVEKRHSKSGGKFAEHHLCAATCDVA